MRALVARVRTYPILTTLYTISEEIVNLLNLNKSSIDWGSVLRLRVEFSLSRLLQHYNAGVPGQAGENPAANLNDLVGPSSNF